MVEKVETFRTVLSHFMGDVLGFTLVAIVSLLKPKLTYTKIKARLKKHFPEIF